jgi:hypothetical protein
VFRKFEFLAVKHSLASFKWSRPRPRALRRAPRTEAPPRFPLARKPRPASARRSTLGGTHLRRTDPSGLSLAATCFALTHWTAVPPRRPQHVIAYAPPYHGHPTPIPSRSSDRSAANRITPPRAGFKSRRLPHARAPRAPPCAIEGPLPSFSSQLLSEPTHARSPCSRPP